MTRKEIRIYARGLVDEYTELSEGLISDDTADETNFDILINIAQQRVMIDLIQYIPWYFRKSVLISTVATQADYEIGDGEDIDIDDFLLFENIYHNKAGDFPQGLAYVEPDQLTDRQIDAQATGEPTCWMYESKDTITLRPTPTATETSRYKGYYFYELADLSDDADVSDLPKITHPLVAIDAARQYHLIDEEEGSDLERRYQGILGVAANNLLSIKPSLGYRGRQALDENVR